jgi:hypothetical protein
LSGRVSTRLVEGVQDAHHNLGLGRQTELRQGQFTGAAEGRRDYPATIRHYAATVHPLLLNAAGLGAGKLLGVKPHFTTNGGKVHREVLLRLVVRLSSGLRSITGQIVVSTQRRLVVAPPPAQSAKENQCN